MVKKIEKISKDNFRREVINNPGGFASLFDLRKLKYNDPILITSTDGVGTKLKIAIKCKKLNYLGFDLVAMCVNDILANGGEPIIFLDYISSSKLSEKDFLTLIKSINNACKESKCSLVGGETAEMPGMYKKNEFDIAGFSVGVVERKNLLTKKNVKSRSVIIGLESNGFHSNGYSLIRNILKINNIKLKIKTPYKSEKKILEDDILKPTKIYIQEVLPLIKKKLISSIAHITGGGIYENLSRCIPENLQADIDMPNFSIPERFIWISKLANLKPKEMLKTFNCGIGLILIVEQRQLPTIKKYFVKRKINFFQMGQINSKVKNNVNINNFGQWHLK